jgi:hypothetical protein
MSLVTDTSILLNSVKTQFSQIKWFGPRVIVKCRGSSDHDQAASLAGC